MTDSAIDICDLTIEVAGKKRILGPISLQIERGEHVLLVGPSGSGKTTLLRTIAGLETPSAGQVHLFGKAASVAGKVLIPAEKRGVGMLFQEGALWPHMNAMRTLTFVLAHRGVARSERRGKAEALLERVGLAGFGTRKPGTLSGGEAQRLALARALAADARILLLDEPLGPLDPARRKDLLEQFQTLQRDLDLTLVHVTHDPGEAAPLASRTLELERGLLS